MALLMVMGLSLLVYALAERSIRCELNRQGRTIPNQVGKPTKRPTLRRIFQVFEGIDLLLIHQANQTQQIVVNLKPIHHQILDLLGAEVKKVLYFRWIAAESRMYSCSRFFALVLYYGFHSAR